MNHHDFQIPFNTSQEQMTKDIVKSLFKKPIKAGLPKVIAIKGPSGSGKSITGLWLQQILYEDEPIKFVDIVDKTVLIKPTSYAPKTKAILKGETPEYKQAFTLQMDEAKFLINADNWQKTKNKAIRAITATCRTEKPMLFIIVAQLLSDIDAKTRRTLDYVLEVKRSPGKKPTVRVYTLWEQITDIDRIKIKRRPIQGVIIYPDGRGSQVVPTFRPSMPDKETLNKYWSFEKPDKSSEIYSLLDDIEKEANKLSNEGEKKLKDFAKWISLNPDKLSEFGVFNKKGWKFDRDAFNRFNYTKSELDKIEDFVKQNLEKPEVVANVSREEINIKP
jgi:hypothetical protein